MPVPLLGSSNPAVSTHKRITFEQIGTLGCRQHPLVRYMAYMAIYNVKYYLITFTHFFLDSDF